MGCDFYLFCAEYFKRSLYHQYNIVNDSKIIRIPPRITVMFFTITISFIILIMGSIPKLMGIHSK